MTIKQNNLEKKSQILSERSNYDNFFLKLNNIAGARSPYHNFQKVSTVDRQKIGERLIENKESIIELINYKSWDRYKSNEYY